MKRAVLLFIIFLFSCNMLWAVPKIPDSRDLKWESKWLNRLEHEDMQVRTQAALKLANAGCTEIQDKLLDMAKNEEFYGARIVAIVALTKIADEHVADILKGHLLEEERQTVRTVLNGAINLLERQKIS